MSGSSGSTGYEYQADAFAFIAAHIVTEHSLSWFDDIKDVPTAVSMETGGAGDDLHVETLDNNPIEVQCKHGAKRDQHFKDAFLNALKGLNSNPNLRVVLFVDNSSSGSIKNDLRQDIIRLGQGRKDQLKDITTNFLAFLKSKKVKYNSEIFSRLRIIVKDLEGGMDGRAVAISLLANLLENPQQAPTAWEILSKDGVTLTSVRGRRTLDAIAKLIGKHVTFSSNSQNYAVIVERYNQWLLTSNKDFFVPGLNVRLPIETAWDEILDGTTHSPSESESIESQVNRYHEWERLTEDARRDANSYIAKDIIIGKPRLIISGGPGAGKSTLGRKLAVQFTNQGKLVLRVSLHSITYLLRKGITFNKALIQVAVEGSGINIDLAENIFASPDLVIADGLDECDPDRTVIANHLFSWSSGHPNCQICVMTRPVGHTANLLPGFDFTELLPLDDSAISKLSEQLIAAKVGDASSINSSRVAFNKLINNKKNSSRVASVASRNPLLLGFLVALFIEGKPLNTKRAVLFEQIIDLIHRTSMSDRLNSVEIDKIIAERVAEVTAWNLINDPNIDRKFLLNESAKDLEQLIKKTSLQARQEAEKSLQFWEQRRLIERLMFGNLEVITFVHLSLGEYLAGRYISQLSDTKLHDWLKESRNSTRWRQPILLACGIGSTNRIVKSLLDWDEPEDPSSTDAILAAFAISESEDVEQELLEKAIIQLRKRLTSEIPLIAIEAGEGLKLLSAFAPDIVVEISEGLLEHEFEWTRLAAFTARIASGNEYVTLEETHRWVNDLRFVRRLHFTQESAETRIEDLPTEAYELQEYSLIRAIDKIFSEVDIETAKANIKILLSRLKQNLTMSLLTKLEEVFGQYGALDMLADIFELESYTKSIKRSTENHKQNNSTDIAIVGSIITAARSFIKNSSEESGSDLDTNFLNLSLLDNGLGFINAPISDYYALSKDSEKAAFEEVLRGAIFVLDINPSELIKEAEIVLSNLQNSEEAWLGQFIRRIPVNPIWQKALSFDLDINKIVSALNHPSRRVKAAAAELLLIGLGGEKALDLVKNAFTNKDQEITIGLISEILPHLFSKHEAINILLERLEGQPSLGFKYIFLTLAELISFADIQGRDRIFYAIIKGLYSDDPKTAEGAANSLANLPLKKSEELIELLKNAFDHWSEKGSWCYRCDLAVHDTGCSNCHIVAPQPRAAIFKVLIKLDAFKVDELLQLCEDKDFDISKEAYKTISKKASDDQTVLEELLKQIKDGLQSFKSSTAYNLLNDLLALPADKLKTVESKVIQILESKIPAIRERIISKLTGEWISPNKALLQAENSLKDTSPSVRNRAIKTLRLLQNKNSIIFDE